jgi:hypothetical protein
MTSSHLSFLRKTVFTGALCAALAAIFFIPEPVYPQSFPGGFIEKPATTGVRPRLTASQIQSFLPSRGKFTFPAPYNTEGVRLTNSSDCGGTDCVNYVGYSYWRNINNHAGSDTMLIFLGLSRSKGGGGPTLFSYNKLTEAVTNLGPLFDAASPFSWSSGEGWYFSATLPTELYIWSSMDTKLYRYDVTAKTFETVLDIATQTGLYGTNRYIWQMHSSDDDRVHIGTVRDKSSYAMLGCFVYEEDIKKYSYYPEKGDVDECNLDKSGRWLLMIDNVDGVYSVDSRIIDLQTGAEQVILDQDGGLGHLDMGDGYAVGADNWNPLPNGTILIKFPVTSTVRPVGPVVHYNHDWTLVAANHVTHQNRKAGVPPEQQYACGSNLDGVATRENEIICFRLDTSYDILVVAPVMTDVNASGGGDTYSKMPKGNLDITGNYFIWTSNMAGNRADAFIVKVPAQLLTGGGDTTPPTVSITAPTSGSTVTGSIAVTAGASDDVGVAGVQFKLDGINLGAEDTTAPYSVSWDTTLVLNGSHALTAVARDAAGNTAASSPVTVSILNGDATAPSITITSPASGSTVGGTITVSANATDDVGVAGVQFKLDGTNLGAEDTTNAYSISWDTASVVNGDHTLTAVARDAAGNISSAAATITVANTAPATVLAGHWKLDEGLGTTASDSSGNGHTGTLINGPAWTTGGINYALSFDGVDDYVHVPHATALDAYPLSIAVWTKTAATGANGIVNKYVPGSRNGYQVFASSGNLCAWYFKDASNYIWDGTGCSLPVPGYNDNQWHHVVFVVDASGGKIYVDGLEKASRAWTGAAGTTSTTQDLSLGRYPGTATPYFPGSLDDVRIYNGALTAAEVLALYNAAAPGADTTPPVITAVGAGSITSTSAAISWSTDTPSNSQVEYGTTAAYGSSTLLDPTAVISHTQSLSELQSATTYHYRVKSTDEAGNTAVSGDFAFTTSAAPDTTGPALSSIRAESIADTSAVIAWATDEPATTQVEYGLTTTYGSTTVLYGSLVTFHSQALTGLQPSTTYHFRVLSRDAAGNLAASGDDSFTTTTIPDTTPPVIPGAVASNITDSEATITWFTSESSTTQVEYGTTPAYGSSTALNSMMVTSHSAVLSGLIPSTTYHYRVVSADAAGNTAVSGDYTFTTSASPDILAPATGGCGMVRPIAGRSSGPTQAADLLILLAVILIRLARNKTVLAAAPHAGRLRGKPYRIWSEMPGP